MHKHMLLQLIWINQQYMDLHQTQFQLKLKILFLVLHGPTSAPINTGAQNTVVNIDQPAVYGPAPDPLRTATGLGQGQILSILVSIILFCIGIAIAVNKGIKKNVKIISLIIISAVIIGLILLTIFVL